MINFILYFNQKWPKTLKFSFCQNYGLSRIIQPKNTKNTLRWWHFFGAIPEIWYKKYGGLRGPKNVEILEFQKVEISKIHIFQGCSSIFSCIFWSKFMTNTGFKGPLRVQKISNFSKFPESSKKYWNRSGIDNYPFWNNQNPIAPN